MCLPNVQVRTKACPTSVAPENTDMSKNPTIADVLAAVGKVGKNVETLSKRVTALETPAEGTTAKGRGKNAKARGKGKSNVARPMFKGAISVERPAEKPYGRAGSFLVFAGASPNSERWIKPVKARKFVDHKSAILAFAKNPTKSPGKGYAITTNDKGARMLTDKNVEKYGWIVNERNAKTLAESPKMYKDIEGFVEHLDTFGPYEAQA